MESLEILRCTKCDAPLVLADGDHITCPSCGTDNVVPAPYRELHRARSADQAARQSAERLLRELDTPPSMAVKILASAVDQNMFVFLLLFGIPVTIGSILFALRVESWIGRTFHYGVDDVPFGYTAVSAIGAIFVCAFVPRALGVYANRRVADRSRLLAALAARPPKVAGAAASCRCCGAPLGVATDQIVAVCSYCGAQNAVRLETKVAAQTSANAIVVGLEVESAAKRDLQERAATRRLMWHELRRYALRTVLLGGGFYLGAQETPDHQSTTLGVIGIVATVLMFIGFILQSMSHADDDADERRAANDVPDWARWAGPVIVMVLLFRVC